MRLNLLRVTPAPLESSLARRLGVADRGCLHREVELCCARQYLELDPVDDLALAAAPVVGRMARLWARRRVFRLAAGPILVQEVFLNGGCAP
jgi:hypothetical protein